MDEFFKLVIRELIDNGCYFVGHGKGDHDI